MKTITGDVVMLPIDGIKEDTLILCDKLYGFNLCGTNSTSMDEDEVRGVNVLTRITRIGTGANKGKIWINSGAEISDLVAAGKAKCQHLYILSDEKLVKGDWYINFYQKSLGQEYVLQYNGWTVDGWNQGMRRIEATTDESLKGVAILDWSFVNDYIDSEGTLSKVYIQMTEDDREDAPSNGIKTHVRNKKYAVVTYKDDYKRSDIDKLKAVYDKHAIFLNNMKENRSQDIDKMTDDEVRHSDELITTLAGVLGDMHKALNEIGYL